MANNIKTSNNTVVFPNSINSTQPGGLLYLAKDNYIQKKVLSQDPNNKDPFWFTPELDPLRWNQLFPYQLMIVRKKDGGSFSLESNYKFTLPFPPEAISRSINFAHTVGAGLEGIVEERSGAPFREIQFAGTLGALPARFFRNGTIKKSTAFLGTIFGGTIDKTQAIASTVTPAQVNIQKVSNEEIQGDEGKLTGYAQLQFLEYFFELYNRLSKSDSNIHLAFAIWKFQHIYLVTPESFRADQSAESPLEYRYSLSLKAWKRIDKLENVEEKQIFFTPAVKSQEILGKVLQSLVSARRAIATSVGVVRALGGDFDKIFEINRQGIVFCKELLSSPLSTLDLPKQILKGTQDTLLSTIDLKYRTGEIEKARNKGGDEGGLTKEIYDQVNKIRELWVKLSKTETQSADSSPSLASSLRNSKTTSTVHDIAESPEKYHALLNIVNVNELKLTNASTQQINADRANQRKLKRIDFEKMRDDLVIAMSDLADAIGVGNDTYNSTYNRAISGTKKTATNSDFNLLFTLNESIQAFNELAASTDLDFGGFKSIDYIAGLAHQSGIAFQTPRSKFLVPFPYGISLEQLSQTYLGTPEKWHEIAALNGLQSPYVDEIGFKLPLLTNSVNRQVVVSDASNLYVNQLVYLQSQTVNRFSVRISSIDTISTYYHIVTVNDDLPSLTTDAGSYLHAYLPYTVNSQQSIYIPSTDTPDQSFLSTKSVPGLNTYDFLFSVGGFDILLNQTNNDLIFSQDGDQPLAIGLSNIVQRARIIAQTNRGDLFRHPDFGMIVPLAESHADTNASSILKAATTAFSNEGMFSGVIDARVEKKGASASIQLSLQIAGGTNQIVPISFDIKTF